MDDGVDAPPAEIDLVLGDDFERVARQRTQRGDEQSTASHLRRVRRQSRHRRLVPRHAITKHEIRVDPGEIDEDVTERDGDARRDAVVSRRHVSREILHQNFRDRVHARQELDSTTSREIR